jgi:hypothetical protein
MNKGESGGNSINRRIGALDCRRLHASETPSIKQVIVQFFSTHRDFIWVAATASMGIDDRNGFIRHINRVDHVVMALHQVVTVKLPIKPLRKNSHNLAIVQSVINVINDIRSVREPSK